MASEPDRTKVTNLAACDRPGKATAALALAGWKPKTVQEAIAHWMANPMDGAKPLGE